MNTSIECDRTLLVQADFDGELDAATAAGLVSHEAGCRHCQSVRQQLERSRKVMRAVPRYAAPEGLLATVRAAQLGVGSASTRAQPGKASFVRSPALGWGAALAASLVLAVVLLVPRSPDVGDQLVANRLRALQIDSHLIDVVSTDHHTVKPWFAGKVNFAPLVKQLDADGYVLKGGRVDIVDGAPTAVLVYQAGRHLVDVYMWPTRSDAGGGLAFTSSRIDGFNLRHWQESGLTLWCVSDLGADEIDHFVQTWQMR